MDNASKALIMAGAILITIMIIGIAVYVFSLSNTYTTATAEDLLYTDVQMFNEQFYRYSKDGDEVMGTAARELKIYAESLKIPVTGNGISDIDVRKKYKVTYSYDTAELKYITSVQIDVLGS